MFVLCYFEIGDDVLWEVLDQDDGRNREVEFKEEFEDEFVEEVRFESQELLDEILFDSMLVELSFMW